jgi:tetratricopeptide (TPR) repeat protein
MTLVAASLLAVSCSDQPSGPPSSPGEKAPLFDNLGNHHMPITTASAEAQKYFDQGVILSYAFNHAEAIRAFKQAAAIDDDCAMCYWGVAFALGPNINAPITEDAAKDAWAAIEEARKRAPKASERERAYIEALARRYTADPKAERPPLDRAYAEAMRALAKRYPDDLDAATLFAQSLMDTAPWNYWDAQGNPREFTGDVLAALESVLARKPDHVGAIHLYIHAVEASPDPKRAERAADRLPALVPGAGHLQHMPAHIYLRTGRYNDASIANQNAIQADDAYFAGDPVAGNMMYEIGYYPHNMHFFVLSASMQGRREDAMKAANDVKEQMHDDMLRDPGMGGMVQHMALTPLYTRVRFHLWDEVLAEPKPAEDMPFMRAMWHASRALAYAAGQKLREAEAERASLEKLKGEPALTMLYVSSVNTAASIAAIASSVVAGEIAARDGRESDAVQAYADAVKREDALIYMEPPDWPIPVRQLQGMAFLRLGLFREAERAFADDMKKFPENGWSLSGLHASLIKQGRTRDAASVDARLKQAWEQADVELVGGRLRAKPLVPASPQ